MRIYTYRPPKINITPPPAPPKHSFFSRYVLGFGVMTLGIGLGLATQYQPQLIRAVVDTESASSASSSLKQADPTPEPAINTMVPFLKTAPSSFKIQPSNPSMPAVGGGPGLVNEVLNTKASISVNFETGEVYYSANSNKRLPMASITKIMTCMVALDLASLDETFTTEEAATKVEPTVIGVRVGERLTTRELIQAGLLTSGNDAMAVLAEGVGKKYGGSTDLFVQAMNEKAKLLGLSNTHFANPQGYDNSQHYSTPEDLVVMSQYAITHYPEIARIVTQKEGHLAANANHHAMHLPNWNMLIDTYPGADGIKIGNTGDAGHTTIASATRQGKRVIVVVLGADGILKRDLAASELLNIGFSKLGISPYFMNETILRTRIKDWY